VSSGSIRTRSTTGRKQLLDGAAGVFEGGGAAIEGVASEARVDVLYRQIGQLKVENDFLARKLGK
jgi:transposase